MNELAALTVDDLLDRLAARSPSPGGGTAAALAGATACALARMVMAYSSGKAGAEPSPEVAAAADRLRTADQLLRALLTRDGQVYERMVEAGKQARADAAARPAYQQAVLEAVGIPLEIAAVCANALALLDETRERVSRYLWSDLEVAALLADAAARSAQAMVLINLPELDDVALREKLANDAAEMIARCAERRDRVIAFVHGRLKPTA